MKYQARSEDSPPYRTDVPSAVTDVPSAIEEELLARARAIIRRQWPDRGRVISNAADAFAALEIHYGVRRTEVMTLMLLNSANQILAIEDVAEGTVDGTAVYPREIMLTVLNFDATQVILAHNHPSGRIQPSEADRELTKKIVAALRTIDVRVLDHVVCGAGEFYSFADHREMSLSMIP